MVQRIETKSTSIVAAIAAMGLLSACTGTSTYGTGVTQEAQLLEDLTSIAMVGQKPKKAPINYTSRPKLVKPPTVAGLPTPAENVESESAYFPVNPEEKRLRTLARIKEAEAKGEAIPEEVALARRESAVRGKRLPRKLNHAEDKYDGNLKPEEEKAARDAFLKRRAELRGATGAGQRRYLTEPPRAYRTPEETAAIGVVGEKEKDPYALKKGDQSLFGKLFGRKKKAASATKAAKSN